MTEEYLEEVVISLSGFLELKPGLASHLVKADSIRTGGPWSASLPYGRLKSLVPRTPSFDHACNTSRDVITLQLSLDQCFLSIMTPSGSYMVPSVEQGVPLVTLADESLRAVGGYVDWTAIVGSPKRPSDPYSFARTVIGGFRVGRL